MRDPRVDPQPGDVVMFGPQWQEELYAVIGIDGDVVHYQLGPMRAVLLCPLKSWRDWAKSGEVLRRGE